MMNKSEYQMHLQDSSKALSLSFCNVISSWQVQMAKIHDLGANIPAKAAINISCRLQPIAFYFKHMLQPSSTLISLPCRKQEQIKYKEKIIKILIFLEYQIHHSKFPSDSLNVTLPSVFLSCFFSYQYISKRSKVISVEKPINKQKQPSTPQDECLHHLVSPGTQFSSIHACLSP